MAFPVENHLIEQLPPAARKRLLALCVPAPLVLASLLQEPGAAVRHVYFPLEGFVSILVPLPGHQPLGIGMVGREGMVGASLALGQTRATLRAQVQGEGASRCIEAPSFRRELGRNVALRQVIARYLGTRMDQLAAGVACQRFHTIEQRLGRWLLMSQDRAQADGFHVTHESLAAWLGVRRVGVTGAAGSLQRAGVIRYHRGEVTVLDRPALLLRACSCYAADRLVDGGSASPADLDRGAG